ncbi:patatin [Actinobacillus succinogenes]|uniref:Patatin n=1 Tax=Actinobacillus succinogenes (strain ATCC 55618 / DSM 22257 / CCUG 43843 / 130Z) TaxID=339671 RepID=A6VQZ0_ACTSZ|nr:patatin-like phospholipase family protein [Actinobacillus succinogenes]ABR75387.1 Patatin [Actinobacillus succinogenes 130Z]PHI40225.1 patatin [Actinobacillus succinogenes]
MGKLRKSLYILTATLLSACNLVTYQPVETISRVNERQGYRLRPVVAENTRDGNLIIVMFSGGGSRAAALGYGVLEQFKNAGVRPTAKGMTLLDNIDLVYGVSGGSVLASYFALEGREVVPKFSDNFLKKNFQREVISQVFSVSNLPRLTSPQFGRGDLLQEQLNITLYHGKTFEDLDKNRKGPFAVISATDMNMGQKITFTQDVFDGLCLNLNDLEIARAVAASSSVPLVFAPLTLNNYGGNCHFAMPKEFVMREKTVNGLIVKNIEETKHMLTQYQNAQERPYIHLVDGGLTDNLGLASLLDMSDVLGLDQMYEHVQKLNLKNIVVINVNAQNEVRNETDKSADVPGMSEVINTIINVPIDNTTQNSLRRFREFTDNWNRYKMKKRGPKVSLHFVGLSMKELPEGELKQKVLNIGTSFYLPKSDVDDLRRAAQILLQNSAEYREALSALQ